MIRLYLKSRNNEYDAVAEFDTSTNQITVLKNSLISSKVAGGMFRSSKAVEKQRQNAPIKNRLLTENICFRSASSAANFVTGSSTNGLVSWKTKEGTTLKDALKVNV